MAEAIGADTTGATGAADDADAAEGSTFGRVVLRTISMRPLRRVKSQ